MELNRITNAMLQCFLDPTIPQETLRETILNCEKFSLIANPALSKNGTFFAYIDDDKSLLVFLTTEEAILFAEKHGYLIDDNPRIATIQRDKFPKLLEGYYRNHHLKKLKVYSRVPIFFELTPDFFLKTEIKVSSPSDIMKTITEPSAPIFLGVSEAIAVFETYENNARRKLDKGEEFQNIHTLVKRLVFQNEIEPEELDKKLELPNGYTRNFFVINEVSPSMEVILKYLSYFGLEKYLYLFKKNCRDMQRYLKQHPEIDKYKLKKSDVLQENFKLNNIIRGNDDKGYYIYKLTLSNQNREITMIVSNPFNCIIGREYQIEGLPDSSAHQVVDMTKKIHCPTNETIKKDLERLENDQEDTSERSFQQQRKDVIIGYFIKQGLDKHIALSQYHTLEVDEEVLNDFYMYINKQKLSPINIEGYTIKKIMAETGLSVYDAHVKMIELKEAPDKAKLNLGHLREKQTAHLSS